jgi:hypothetical protein
MSVIVTPVVTPSLDAYTSDQRFPLGAQVTTNDGMFEYVQVLSAVSQYNAVGIDTGGLASNLTTTLAATVKRVGVAQLSIAVSCYGWVQRSGHLRVQCAQACQDFVALFTTATAGVLDDATVSECLVLGLNTVNSSSTASALTAIGAAPFQIFPFANPA